MDLFDLRYCILAAVFLFFRQECGGFLLRVKRGPRKPSFPPARHCTSDTITYHISQSWYPALLPCGYVDCIKCSCILENNAAKVVCKNLDGACPGAYLRPGDCCKTCPGLSRQVKRSTDKSCTYSNTAHAHGTVWKVAPNNPADLDPGQCTECSCWDGFVSCAIRTCPKLNCQRPVPSMTSCCPTCPGPAPIPLPKKGCSSLGREYFENEAWHPMLRPYKTKCIVCKCKNSVVRCDKVKCDAANCDPHCCKCPVSARMPAVQKPKRSSPMRVRYPDCHFNGRGIKRHNTTWKPTIGGVASNCFVCKCQFSKVRCAKIICPKNYSCPDPRPMAGECCKVCKGFPNRFTAVRLGNRKRKLCGLVGKKWLVYDFTSTETANNPSLHAASGVFALEEVVRAHAEAKVEMHTLTANRTHKHVWVKSMSKKQFDKWVNQDPARANQRPIGVLREGRRKRIEDKESKNCTSDCHVLVRNVMRMLRNRSRSCRASEYLPPVTLTALKEGL